MENKMPCEVIKDLLPSYIDELTSDVTNGLVEEHVENCTSCKEVLDAMKAQDMTSAERQKEAQEKEIDFLKKARRRTRRIVVGSIASAFVIFLVLVFVNRFIVGNPVGNESVYCRAEVTGSVMTIEATMMDSARVPVGVRFEEEEPGIVKVSYKAALVSPWNNRGILISEYTSKSQIKQVKVDDQIIWADGEDILSITSALYTTRHPYIGDMSANALPVAVLNMGNCLGGFANELQTSEEPYGWTFELAEDMPTQHTTVKEKAMRSFAYALLAVVENLGEVTYEYTVDGKESKLTVTEEEATAYAGYDIKACYSDIVLLQELIKKTGLDDYAFMNTVETNAVMDTWADEGEILINVVNNAEDDIFSMGLSYGVDGNWKGEQCSCRADNECLRRGESTTFTIYPQDLELFEWDGNTEAVFELEVSDKDDHYYKVQTSFKLPAKGAAIYTYVLSGNALDGYTISQ